MDELTVGNVFKFAAEQVEIESEDASHEIPKHAETIVNTRVADMLRTVKNIEMAVENDEIDSADDERAKDALQADVVDVLLALGAFVSERDLDIETELRDRIDEIESLREFEARLDECESDEEIVDALEDTMGEDIENHPMVQQMQSGVETGDNVDMDDYPSDGSVRDPSRDDEASPRRDGDQRGVY